MEPPSITGRQRTANNALANSCRAGPKLVKHRPVDKIGQKANPVGAKRRSPIRADRTVPNLVKARRRKANRRSTGQRRPRPIKTNPASEPRAASNPKEREKGGLATRSILGTKPGPVYLFQLRHLLPSIRFFRYNATTFSPLFSMPPLNLDVAHYGRAATSVVRRRRAGLA